MVKMMPAVGEWLQEEIFERHDLNAPNDVLTGIVGNAVDLCISLMCNWCETGKEQERIDKAEELLKQIIHDICDSHRKTNYGKAKAARDARQERGEPQIPGVTVLDEEEENVH